MKTLAKILLMISVITSCNRFEKGDNVIILQGKRKAVVVSTDYLHHYTVRYQTDIGDYKEIILMDHEIKLDSKTDE